MKPPRLYGAFLMLMLTVAAFAAGPSAKKAHAEAHAKAAGAAKVSRLETEEQKTARAVTGVLSEIPGIDHDPDDWMKLPVGEETVAADSLSRYSELTDADFRLVADELKVEVAAIKAVVEIEAGKQMKGFWAPGVPVINFDGTMFARFRPKSSSKGETQKVPKGLSGYALREWTQLVNARKINRDAADMGTFWGMFQIGGFNYKTCGCTSVGEMVKRMSYSELEQLELFAAFITNSGMLADLRARNWSAFARKYNGPSYARRGYHTRMANAYARYKK